MKVDEGESGRVFMKKDEGQIDIKNCIQNFGPSRPRADFWCPIKHVAAIKWRE